RADEYSVVEACDGAEGFNRLQLEEFDAVITDIQMPNMNGLELTRAIRKQERFAYLPIVIVTSQEKDEEKREGIEAGANAYLLKTSFDQEKLLETLARLVGKP
ncbi:MAG: response regulator, partial [Planctomycetes bacterium]|nr:response regulator [Planctomycetota bacterium]